ncbi:hypothetical protein GmHk_14G041649 [Glycine max]|nr:hypothetical protein GmHk_14G041649 [Glycine max]
MPLKGRRFVAYPYQTRWGALSIAHNHNPCILRWEESLLLWWRDLVAQVAPSVMEREIITMIVDTLLVFYYEKMVGYTPSSITDLVFTDERIKVGLRRGKFDYPALMNRKLGENGENKKEGGTHVVTPQSPPVVHPIPNTTLNTNRNTNQGRNFPEKKHVEFTPISVSYANLLLYLLSNAMVAIIPAKIPQPPFSQGYISNATLSWRSSGAFH